MCMYVMFCILYFDVYVYSVYMYLYVYCIAVCVYMHTIFTVQRVNDARLKLDKLRAHLTILHYASLKKIEGDTEQVRVVHYRILKTNVTA